MGNKQLEEAKSLFEYRLQTEYFSEGTKQLPPFGKVELLLRNQKESALPPALIAFDIFVDSRESLAKVKQLYLNSREVRSVLGPLHLEPTKGHDSRQAKVYAQYSEHRLSGLVSTLRKRGTPLAQSELWTIFHQIARAVDHYHSKGVFNGHISSGNILLSAPLSPKVIDRSLISKEHQPEMPFVSPEVLKHLEYEHSQFDMDPFKNDVYAMGVVFVELASLELASDIFDEVRGKLQGKKLTAALRVTGERYGDRLSQLIKDMLTTKAQTRISAKEVLQDLEGRGRRPPPKQQQQKLKLKIAPNTKVLKDWRPIEQGCCR